jgi:hypothetical protein
MEDWVNLLLLVAVGIFSIIASIKQQANRKDQHDMEEEFPDMPEEVVVHAPKAARTQPVRISSIPDNYFDEGQRSLRRTEPMPTEETEEITVADEEPAAVNPWAEKLAGNPDEVKKAVIYSEIFMPKY